MECSGTQIRRFRLYVFFGATALERWGRNAEPFMQRGLSLTLVWTKAKEVYKAEVPTDDEDGRCSDRRR